MCRWVSVTLLHMCKGFSHLNEEGDDSDVIWWCHWCPYVDWRKVLEKAHTRLGVLLLLVLGPFGSFPGWSIWEATDPLTWLPWCLLRSGTITRQGSVLYLFNCMCLRLCWASWVSVLQLLVSQPGILPPCVYLTWYQKGKDHHPLEWNSACGINCNLSEPTKSIQHSWRESLFWYPRVGSKEVASSQRSGSAALGCGSSQLSLKLLIWWFDKAGEYLFQGWKCPHICTEVHWWQLNGSPTHHGSDVANASPVVS